MAPSPQGKMWGLREVFLHKGVEKCFPKDSLSFSLSLSSNVNANLKYNFGSFALIVHLVKSSHFMIVQLAKSSHFKNSSTYAYVAHAFVTRNLLPHEKI